jgi:hypothetical protein
MTVRLTSAGALVKTAELRAENLVVDRPVRRVAGGVVEWRVRVKDAAVPWVALVVPDGNLLRRREVVEADPARH